MSKWVWKGLRTGKKTTHYPAAPETAAGVSPGLPDTAAGNIFARPLSLPDRRSARRRGQDESRTSATACTVFGASVPPPGKSIGKAAMSGPRRQGPIRWGPPLGGRFQPFGAYPDGRCRGLRCVHQRSQADRQAVLQYPPPGLFRHAYPQAGGRAAGAGAGPRKHGFPLKKAYAGHARAKNGGGGRDLRPDRLRVRAGFQQRSGVAGVIPVDVEVPGCPPPPLALVHALLVAVGRKPSASMAPQAASVPERSGP